MKEFFKNFEVGLLIVLVALCCCWLVGVGFITGFGVYPLAEYVWYTVIWLGFFVSLFIWMVGYCIYRLGRWARGPRANN